MVHGYYQRQEHDLHYCLYGKRMHIKQIKAEITPQIRTVDYGLFVGLLYMSYIFIIIIFKFENIHITFVPFS